MTKQVKVFFIVLAAMAVVSVMSFFDIFRGVKSSVYDAPPEPLADVASDFDRDGLSDADESYWNTDLKNPDSDGDGYLDGEEVASGNDPRESAEHPLGDSLRDTVYGAPKDIGPDFNITDNMTTNMINGIYAGDMKPGNDDDLFQQGTDALSLSVVDNFQRIQAIPETTLNIVGDSKQEQEAYLSGLSGIIKGNLMNASLRVTLNGTMDLSGQFQIFKEKSVQFKKAYDNAVKLMVPQSWTDIHKEVLALLYLYQINNQFVAEYETDVLKSAMALGNLSNLPLQLPGLLGEIRTKIDENKLTLSDDIFRILDLIYQTQ